MVNKKIVIICTVVAIIITAIIVSVEVKKIKRYNPEDEIDISFTTKNTTQNQVENETEDDDIVENTVVENETQKENVVEPESTYQGEEESKDDETQDNSNSVLDLVKNEWGEDDTVYYTIDNQSGNIYTVSVRSKITTQTLAEYEVDITQKTVVLQ